MEALAALGLACNIVQFLEFGQKLVGKTIELYRSNSGSLSTTEELRVLTEELNAICVRFDGSDIDQDPLAEGPDLQKLTQDCRSLAVEFLVFLQDLGTNSQHKRWSSLRQAWKSSLKESRIAEYNQRLDRFRSQINIGLIELLCQQNSKVVIALEDLSHRQTQHSNAIYNKVSQLRSEIADLLGKQQKENKDKKVQQINLQSIHEPSFLHQVSASLDSLVREAAALGEELRILDSLHFESLDARRSMVPDASLGTFEWIMDSEFSPGSEFSEWLIGTPDRAFWITGKPGSGKSTLMKFLCSNTQIRRQLELWAGTRKKLHIAHFFFWKAGNRMQKSQQGLLQTLLYHILRQSRDLIPTICPERWKIPHTEGEGWTMRELATAFKKLAIQKSQSSRFCFFIDGLDEYEGDHLNLMNLVQGLVSVDIKVCFSSRPWNVFEAGYREDDPFRISIHEYTKSDIETYVKQHLEHDIRFIQVKSEDKRYQDLIHYITEKAQGVFLWVFLVVQSLRRGLIQDDTIGDLQERVEAFPTDLEGYFRLMLNTIEKFYHVQAARMYLVCLAAQAPLDVHILACLDSKTSKLALAVDAENWPTFVIESDDATAVRRIKARCPDLLQIVQAGNSHFVHFLHRTVRDFFESVDIATTLEASAGSFNPDLFICQASLVMRTMESNFSARKKADTFMYHAKTLMLEDSNHKYQMILQTLINHLVDTPKEGYQNEWRRRDITGLAIQHSFHFYLHFKKELVQQCIAEEHCRQSSVILRSALLGSQNLDPSIVSVLLEYGANPNAEDEYFKNGTVWTKFLEKTLDSFEVQSSQDSSQMHNIFCCIKLCIQHHADTHISIHVIGSLGFYQALPLGHVLHSIFPPSDAWSLYETARLASNGPLPMAILADCSQCEYKAPKQLHTPDCNALPEMEAQIATETLGSDGSDRVGNSGTSSILQKRQDWNPTGVKCMLM